MLKPTRKVATSLRRHPYVPPFKGGDRGDFDCSRLTDRQLACATDPHPALRATLSRGARGHCVHRYHRQRSRARWQSIIDAEVENPTEHSPVTSPPLRRGDRGDFDCSRLADRQLACATDPHPAFGHPLPMGEGALRPQISQTTLTGPLAVDNRRRSRKPHRAFARYVPPFAKGGQGGF
jgi:hypothetical protein